MCYAIEFECLLPDTNNMEPRLNALQQDSNLQMALGQCTPSFGWAFSKQSSGTMYSIENRPEQNRVGSRVHLIYLHEPFGQQFELVWIVVSMWLLGLRNLPGIPPT